ncbi:MAG: ABC transporter ATP-binding protein [Anaerolineaceae bacterium]|nr:ABC transporter ATP-binding protein [Anaerolineaceae bacterium]
MAIIEIENLTYTYPVENFPALHGVNLRVEEGEWVVVSGENEAGKSTLCCIIAGLIPSVYRGKLEGTVRLCSLDVCQASRKDLIHRVGMVMQNPFHQISGGRFTVAEEVAFGLENLGVPRPEMHWRVNDMLAQVGIAHLARCSPFSLSGGQQQLVALAAALVMHPEVLVLDEPTSQLDPQASQKVLAVVQDLQKQGLTVVLVEHRLEWAAEFASRLVILEKGTICADGLPAQVFAGLAGRASGVHFPAVTLLGFQARREGLWPAGRPLPVTIEQAVRGFRR